MYQYGFSPLLKKSRTVRIDPYKKRHSSAYIPSKRASTVFNSHLLTECEIRQFRAQSRRLQKITSQTRTIEIETSTAENIPSEWNAQQDHHHRTWRHADPAQGGHLEAAQRETGCLAPFSNPCQYCTFLKPARSLKPVALLQPLPSNPTPTMRQQKMQISHFSAAAKSQ